VVQKYDDEKLMSVRKRKGSREMAGEVDMIRYRDLVFKTICLGLSEDERTELDAMKERLKERSDTR